MLARFDLPHPGPGSDSPWWLIVLNQSPLDPQTVVAYRAFALLRRRGMDQAARMYESRKWD